MKYPGYWVVKNETGVTITHVEFDETELDSDTGWTEAWKNSESNSLMNGYVDQAAALACAVKFLSFQ